MGKTRDDRLPWDARAAEVIAGRLRLDAVPLIALVNEVNPTGRGRDAKESAARYALKARLQSLLVSRFADAIEVVLDPDLQGVVSLRHRSHRQAACHAVLEALDDDARSWVQRQLDLGGAEPDEDEASALVLVAVSASSGEDDDPSDPEEMLRAAARAEEEYDYERARRLHTLALHERRDARSALGLLRFLVDVMAADGEALALEGELPAAVRAHAGVRVLLGLAAARSGEEVRAVAHLAHVEDPRAAEALALLARGAIARGDTDAAALRLSEAEAADPGYPDLRSLAEDLAKAREAQRAPLEAELGRLLSEGRDAEATARAEEILARWPESEAARRASRTLDARRQNEEGRRLLAEGEAARARGEIATARLLFQRVVAVRGDEEARARARRAVAELEAEEHEREAARRVERVAASLVNHDGGSPPPYPAHDKQERSSALAAYVELDDALRSRVRERAGLPALEWMDAMTRAGIRARTAVDAALALERAAALKDADPSAVLGLLAPHERALEAVPLARRLADQAHERAAEERRQKALADLQAAEEAYAAGDTERCQRLLDRAGHDLGREDRGRADTLRARLAALAERQQLQKRYERARAAHDYAGARQAAEALAAGAEGAERARWQEVARTGADEVRREQRVRVFVLDAGAECSRASYISTYPPTVPQCVDLRAGVVILPAVGGRELFVRAFSLETGRLVRAVHLLAPEGLDEPKLELSGDRVLVMGGSNGVLEVSLASGEPLRWSHYRDASDMERRFYYALEPVPGGRYRWVVHSGDRIDGHVYELSGERPVREIPGATDFFALPGATPPRVAALRNEKVLSLHEPGGIQTARHDFPGELEAVAPHPVGDGLVVVFYRLEDRYNIEDALVWGEASAQGRPLRTEVILGAAPYARVAIGCARDLGMAFITFTGADTDQVLLALASSPSSGSLRVAYRVRLGPQRILVQDQDGRRVYVIGEHDGGLEVIPLGPEPPVLPDRGPPQERLKFPLQKLWDCTEPGGERSTRARGYFMQRFKWHSLEVIRERSLALRAQMEGDREALLALFWGHALSNDSAGAGELAVWLLERYPDDPEVRQASWAGLAVERRWEELIALLDPIDPATLPEGAPKHRHHLLAAARFAVGDVARAALHLEEGKDLPGSCDLNPLFDLHAALAEDLPSDDAPGDLPPLRQLLAIIRAADTRLERGDHEGVLSLFERALVWELDESQSLARLAVAHLARPALTEADRLRKSLALALFADTLDENRVGFRAEVLVPGATWREERLRSIAARAAAWLAVGSD